MPDIEPVLPAVFALGRAPQSATGLLFQDENGQPDTRPPMDWPDVARAIDGGVDGDLAHARRPDDVRWYLPGLVPGLTLFETRPGSRLGCAVLSGLYSDDHPTHGDARFLDRRCRFTPAQTQALVRMRATDMAADGAADKADG